MGGVELTIMALDNPNKMLELYAAGQALKHYLTPFFLFENSLGRLHRSKLMKKGTNREIEGQNEF